MGRKGKEWRRIIGIKVIDRGEVRIYELNESERLIDKMKKTEKKDKIAQIKKNKKTSAKNNAKNTENNENKNDEDEVYEYEFNQDSFNDCMFTDGYGNDDTFSYNSYDPYFDDDEGDDNYNICSDYFSIYN